MDVTGIRPDHVPQVSCSALGEEIRELERTARRHGISNMQDGEAAERVNELCDLLDSEREQHVETKQNLANASECVMALKAESSKFEAQLSDEKSASGRLRRANAEASIEVSELKAQVQ